jgi:hypothetical protein
MHSDHQTESHAPPPHVQLIQMATSAWVARTLHAAAMLGLADQLAGGPKSAAELAGPMRAHAPSLHRLMRTLASLGILTEHRERRYALTTFGEALKNNAPGAARSTVLALGSPWAQSAWEHLVYSVQTGKTGFEKAQGMPLFDYLAQHPEDALFNETMVGRLLIAEMVLPAGDEPHPGKMLDMAMLVWPGGQERTLAEYDHLLSKAGFHLTRVVSTNSAVNVVEAVLARAN